MILPWPIRRTATTRAARGVSATLLLQVAFHAGSRGEPVPCAGRIDDVAGDSSDNLVRRPSHVLADP